MAAGEDRLPPVPNKYPTPYLSDSYWERIVRALQESPRKFDRAMAVAIDDELQEQRARWKRDAEGGV